MTLFFSLTLLLANVYIVLSDFFYRRIQNKVVVLLLFVWVLSQLVELFYSDSPFGHQIHDTLYTIAGALFVFVIGYGLFVIGRMGAGDVKFIAVMCLWVGFDQQLVFLIITSLFGGFLALCLPVLNYLERLIAPPVIWMAHRFPKQVPMPTTYDPERPIGIPYGLAISFGAVVCTFFYHF